MLVTDTIDKNSFDILFSNDDDGFLSSLQIDSDVPMSLENTLDFTLLQDDVTDAMSEFELKYSSPNHNYKLESMADFPDMITDASDLNFFNGYINPDEYFTDVKSEIKSEANSPNRDTPSPSSGSSDFSSFIGSPTSVTSPSTISSSGSSDYSSFTGSQTSATSPSTISSPKNTCNYVNVLDTPPISPPSSLSPPPLSPPPILMNSSSTSGIQIVQGTLIPVKTVPLSTKKNENILSMKKIKIQPKPSQSQIGSISKNTNKKTIVLSAQDFSALVQKVKSLKAPSSEAPSIILKTTNNQILKKEPIVLPKTNNLTQIKSIVPTVTKSQQIPNRFVYDYDDKTMKKQQRMIKNRESACLSRKKKKEYVTSLENKISQLSLENVNLKSENTNLKKQLLERDETCCCKKSNTLPTIFKSTTARKSTAVFLAVIFMVSINVGSFGFFNTIRESSINSPKTVSQQVAHHSRGLLWVVDDYKNDTILYYENGTSSNSDAYPICPMYVNQTESIRLASELRRWIGEPDYFNLSITKNDKQLNDQFEIKSFSQVLLPEKHTKNLFNQIKSGEKSPLKTRTRRKLRSTKKKDIITANDLLAYKNTNHIQVFNPSNNALKYAEFFEEIRRRDDTFYVVSFSGDHLLLPALKHNKTLRPKMSLMLPTLSVHNDSFTNDFVTLMQIDCEVINTSILRVREKLIPDNLRNNPKDQQENHPNTNTNQNISKTAERMETNDRNISRKLVPNHIKHNYKPYFIDKTLHNNYGSNIDFKP